MSILKAGSEQRYVVGDDLEKKRIQNALELL
jgi:hypothetical protein